MKSAAGTASISRRSRPSVSRWMRANSLRSHHSCSTIPGVNRPRSTVPIPSRAASAISTSAGRTPRRAAKAGGVTGPATMSHPRTICRMASSCVSSVCPARGSAMVISGVNRTSGTAARTSVVRSAAT